MLITLNSLLVGLPPPFHFVLLGFVLFFHLEYIPLSPYFSQFFVYVCLLGRLVTFLDLWEMVLFRICSLAPAAPLPLVTRAAFPRGNPYIGCMGPSVAGSGTVGELEGKAAPGPALRGGCWPAGPSAAGCRTLRGPKNNASLLVGKAGFQSSWLWDTGGLTFCSHLTISFLLLIWV